ncbi:GNAT family N-acetyltransferase [Rhodococcus sp. F64268]|uniref:GNAT family N-acetyltransferase n=1 Tax=Rhodococcus sp. F64268 TaxID=2926402 RepID=UPI001FF679B5|nr:GNAT family N-acetyltransferase [Rhodococcus sp. F64268]MCK0090981.1 GNAT family N-acetyltransferase [Rhodococcus sp. F64268]
MVKKVTMQAVRITELHAGAGTEVSATVADLVNSVYAVAEDGMWTSGTTRTSSSEVDGMIRAGEMIAAWLGDTLVGCIRVVRLDAATAEFGMLAAAPRFRGHGIGRRLIDFAEQRCAAAGCDVMQLEIIRPRDTELPSKRFLARWYTALGYRPVHTGPVDAAHPELVAMLAVPCEVDTYRRDLRLDEDGV